MWHHRDAFDDAQRNVHVVLNDDVADVGGQGVSGFQSTRVARLATGRRRLVETG
jgi:hypothetical protein